MHSGPVLAVPRRFVLDITALGGNSIQHAKSLHQHRVNVAQYSVRGLLIPRWMTVGGADGLLLPDYRNSEQPEGTVPCSSAGIETLSWSPWAWFPGLFVPSPVLFLFRRLPQARLDCFFIFYLLFHSR